MTLTDWLEHRELYWIVGAAMAALAVHGYARGAQVWARRAVVLLPAMGVGAVVAANLAEAAPIWGWTAVGLIAGGTWALAWLAFGVLTLWRNNAIIGWTIDRWFLAFGISVLSVTAVLSLGLTLLHIDSTVWLYVTVPLLAGGLYRLLLLVMFYRRPPSEQEAVGRTLDRRILGSLGLSLLDMAQEPMDLPSVTAAPRAGWLQRVARTVGLGGA